MSEDLKCRYVVVNDRGAAVKCPHPAYFESRSTVASMAPERVWHNDRPFAWCETHAESTLVHNIYMDLWDTRTGRLVTCRCPQKTLGDLCHGVAVYELTTMGRSPEETWHTCTAHLYDILEGLDRDVEFRVRKMNQWDELVLGEGALAPDSHPGR